MKTNSAWPETVGEGAALRLFQGHFPVKLVVCGDIQPNNSMR
jgi:hypothetical protein